MNYSNQFDPYALNANNQISKNVQDITFQPDNTNFLNKASTMIYTQTSHTYNAGNLNNKNLNFHTSSLHQGIIHNSNNSAKTFNHDIDNLPNAGKQSKYFEEQKRKLNNFSLASNKKLEASDLIDSIILNSKNIVSHNDEQPSSDEFGDFCSADQIVNYEAISFQDFNLPSNSYMINNLTQKVPIESSCIKHLNNIEDDLQPNKLPKWVSDKSMLPEIYHDIILRTTKNNIIQTDLLYPILLKTGLSVEILAALWDLCNKIIPGQLNDNELVLLLAMVAMAQKKKNYSSLSVLSFENYPPIPYIYDESHTIISNNIGNSLNLQIPIITENICNKSLIENPMISNVRDSENDKNAYHNNFIKDSKLLDDDLKNITLNNSNLFLTHNSTGISNNKLSHMNNILPIINNGSNLNVYNELPYKNLNIKCTVKSNDHITSNNSPYEKIILKQDIKHVENVHLTNSNDDDFDDFVSAVLPSQSNILNFMPPINTMTHSFTKIETLLNNNKCLSNLSALDNSISIIEQMQPPHCNAEKNNKPIDINEKQNFMPNFNINFNRVDNTNFDSTLSFTQDLNKNNSNFINDIETSIAPHQILDSKSDLNMNKYDAFRELENDYLNLQSLTDQHKLSSDFVNFQTKLINDDKNAYPKIANSADISKYKFIQENIEDNIYFSTNFDDLKVEPIKNDMIMMELPFNCNAKKSGFLNLSECDMPLENLSMKFDQVGSVSGDSTPGNADDLNLEFEDFTSYKDHPNVANMWKDFDITMGLKDSQSALSSIDSPYKDAAVKYDNVSMASLDFKSANAHPNHLLSCDVHNDTIQKYDCVSMASLEFKANNLNMMNWDIAGRGGVEKDIFEGYQLNEKSDIGNQTSGLVVLNTNDRFLELCGEIRDEDRITDEWKQCLSSVLSILECANESFASVSNSNICNEVQYTEKGSLFIAGVTEIYLIAKRISLEMEKIVSNAELVEIWMQIKSQWGIFSLLFHFDPHVLSANDINYNIFINKMRTGFEEKALSACAICLMNIHKPCDCINTDEPEMSKCQLASPVNNLDEYKNGKINVSKKYPPNNNKNINEKIERINSREAPDYITFGGHQYHTTCANFWVNCVMPTLPALVVPLLL